MAKINDYYQKKQLMEQLAAEINQLENDQALKQELAFESRVRELMEEFDKSPKQVLRILTAIDPSIGGAKAESTASPRAKRPMKTYKNPHTGEEVKTRGGNHKVLNEWRQKHGKETVQSWQQN